MPNTAPPVKTQLMNDEKFRSELLLLLRNAYDDIERTKQMQWRDFYYALIAIGAVTGFYSAVYEKLHYDVFHYLFFIMPILLLIVGFLLIESSQTTLEQRRKLVDDKDGYYAYLEQPLQDVLNGPLAKPEGRSIYPWIYRVGIVGMTAFGFAVMLGLKLSESCLPH